MKSKSTATKKKDSTSVKLQPLGDRVVVEREELESTTAGGIFLPDSAKGRPSRGRVISVGEGRLLKDGSRSPLQVKPGEQPFGPELEPFDSEAEPFRLQRGAAPTLDDGAEEIGPELDEYGPAAEAIQFGPVMPAVAMQRE